MKAGLALRVGLEREAEGSHPRNDWRKSAGEKSGALALQVRRHHARLDRGASKERLRLSARLKREKKANQKKKKKKERSIDCHASATHAATQCFSSRSMCTPFSCAYTVTSASLS